METQQPFQELRHVPKGQFVQLGEPQLVTWTGGCHHVPTLEQSGASSALGRCHDVDEASLSLGFGSTVSAPKVPRHIAMMDAIVSLCAGVGA